MPKLANYTYSGPSSGVTLDTPKGPQEILFFTGKIYSLDSESNYVKGLIELGHLKPLPDSTDSNPVLDKPTKKEKK